MSIVAEYEKDPDARVHTTLDLDLLYRLVNPEDLSDVEFFNGSELNLEMIEDVNTRVSFNQKLAIFENIIAHTQQPDIALIAGSKAQFSDFGFFGYAVISSDNMADAIELGFKYLRLAGPVLRKKFSVVDGQGLFEGYDLLDLGRLLPFCTEYWFASINALCSEALGKAFPNKLIRLPFPKPEYSEKYQSVFGCPVEFDADSIQWFFDAEVLKEPVPHANPVTVKMCIQSCNDMLKTLESPNNLAQKIGGFLLESTGQFPDIEAVAYNFNMSSRHLRRQLKLENTSFQNILDSTRLAMAKQYLNQTELTIDEIASRLGFSEGSNFRIAFKKWQGMTPRQFRIQS